MTRTRAEAPTSSQPQTQPGQTRAVDLGRLAASVVNSLKIEGFDVTAQTLLEQHGQHRKCLHTILGR